MNLLKEFVRVAAVVPEMKVAEVSYNVKKIQEVINELVEKQVEVAVFPELSITGYTCGDLFFQDQLLKKSMKGLYELMDRNKTNPILIAVGMPLAVNGHLFNVAVLIQKGKLVGIVPKTYLKNTQEYCEKRWFDSGKDYEVLEIEIHGQRVPFGTDLLFESQNGVVLGLELGEDLWSMIPPSTEQALGGANVILNLSASNEVVGRVQERRDLVNVQARKLQCAYVYTSAGTGESTTDLVFAGHAFISEKGNVLAETKLFQQQTTYVIQDLDVQKLINLRRQTHNLNDRKPMKQFRKIIFDRVVNRDTLLRTIAKNPFVPEDPINRSRYLRTILEIQAAGLVKRLTHLKIDTTIIGISGGLDSTLAFLAIINAYQHLHLDPKKIIAVTMPGFGTTDRTYKNAVKLIQIYGATLKEIPIRDACIQHFKDLNHDPSRHDTMYENSQARERTQILMDLANQYHGIVIGTGDLSELALGWCTYNGDHMSMYAINASIPKTLVQQLVTEIANETPQEKQQILLDIVRTPISPELLPGTENKEIEQKTEELVGPYELHDFFLYHFLRDGATPIKIQFLARHAFQDRYTEEEIAHWLHFFLHRFFTQQFKRNCLPEGPKVGCISLSPRGDLHMPSDACDQSWVEDIIERK